MLDICDAFAAASEMLAARGHAPFKGKVITEIVGPWTVCLNATPEPVAVEPEGTMYCSDLPPFHFVVFFNGWLCGLFHAGRDGVFVVGDAANEESFIEAMQAVEAT